MQNKFIIGCFYTENTPYKEVFDKFLFPCLMDIKYRFTWKIYTSPNQGSWIKNVAQKPLKIWEMLNTLYETKDESNLVFLDADSTIEKYPSLFEEIPENVDIAFHKLDWNTWYKNGSNVKELLTGTMFFRNSEKVRNLCLDWHETAKATDKWEQKVLEEILLSRQDIVTYELPIEYCYIKTLPDGNKPHVECEPVIVHHQVSRQLRKVLK